MQNKTDEGEAAFSVHVGDILKGNGGGGTGNTRCQDSSFTSRKNLFSQLDNFLLVPGGMFDIVLVLLVYYFAILHVIFRFHAPHSHVISFASACFLQHR